MVRHRKWTTRSKFTSIVYSFGVNFILTELVDRAFHKNRFTNGLLYFSLYITRVFFGNLWTMIDELFKNRSVAMRLPWQVLFVIESLTLWELKVEITAIANKWRMFSYKKTTNKNYRISETLSKARDIGIHELRKLCSLEQNIKPFTLTLTN